jgi:hypothetical protein
VPEPRANDAIIFEDFFAAELRMPPLSFIVDILRKFWVQLHHLTLNAIIQIGKFIWAITSYGGRETTLAAQFGWITFHPIHYRGGLTPIVRDNWTSGWDSNWFYYKVPSEQLADV